ncbi:MAG: glycosyltransferase family protein [Lysobacter sp.]|nr:glycosyltransferase family protein [Lysobacter sp.]
MTTTTDFDRHWAEAAACHGRGDEHGAILALHRAVTARPDDMRALAHLCRTLYENPALFVPPPAPRPAAPAPLVSVVACSIDAAKFDRVRASYARAFGSDPWELIGIHDARSLSEGYARGFAQASGDLVVFSHDDIEILTGGIGAALASALAAADVAGLVGTTHLTGPAFAWSGKAHARGRVAEPARGRQGVDLVVFNPVPRASAGMQALDGVFIAATRRAVEAVGFDAVTFDGFHLYDMDFTYRAHLAGLSVAITPDIVIRHDSTGSFDGKWEGYAARFLAKFPGLLRERQRSDMLRIPFASGEEVAAFCARLDEAGRAAHGV